MLPVMNQGGSQDEKRLRHLFRGMEARDRDTLLRFAEFLAASPVAVPRPEHFPEPLVMARPDQENVVKAIKRLTATYPMLNPEELLHQTADLMSAHVVRGKPAAEVIDELEALFAAHYQQAKARHAAASLSEVQSTP